MEPGSPGHHSIQGWTDLVIMPRTMTISRAQDSASPRRTHVEQGIDLSHLTLRDAQDRQLRGARCVLRRVEEDVSPGMFAVLKLGRARPKRIQRLVRFYSRFKSSLLGSVYALGCRSQPLGNRLDMTIIFLGVRVQRTPFGPIRLIAISSPSVAVRGRSKSVGVWC